MLAQHGDISFYSSDGLSQALFWDASAESLGIGDSSPDGILDVEGSITIAGSQAGVIFNPSVTPANNNVGSVGLVSGTLNAPASTNASSKISGLRVAPTTSGSFNGAGEIAGIKVETFNGQSATLATGLYVDAPTGGDVNYAAILNGGNVGIGTSSPARGLSIHKEGNQLQLTTNTTGTAAGNGTDLKVDASTSDFQLLNYESANTTFWTSGTERLRIDANGNVGIGVVPKAWNSNNTALQIGDAGVLFASTNDSFVGLSANAYFDSTNSRYEYINTDFATMYQQLDGTHVWSTAASGSADAEITFSEAMRIDASGNVLVGGTAQAEATSVTLNPQGYILRQIIASASGFF